MDRIDNNDFNVRSSSYYIAQTTTPCWECRKQTCVFGFILPLGHETLEPDDESDVWYRQDDPSIVHNITKLLPAVAARMNSLSQNFRLDFSKTTQSSYWMNHCDQCGTKQGDFELYSEPEGAFFPVDEHSASQIILHPVSEPFGCDGIAAYSSFIEFTQRAYEASLIKEKI